MEYFIILLFFVILVAAATLYAQDEPKPKWLTDSSRALQFGVTGNFTLGTFDGKSISFKQQLTATKAIRIGVSFSGAIDQKGESHENYYNDSLTLLSNGSYRPTYNVGLAVSAQYLWYMSAVDRFFFYLGAGPYASYSRNGSLTGSSGSSSKTEIWSAGAGGTAGIECFVFSRVSLHAEYTTLLTYTSTHSSSTYIYHGSYSRSETSGSWDKILNLSSGRVVFGLSVYF